MSKEKKCFFFHFKNFPEQNLCEEEIKSKVLATKGKMHCFNSDYSQVGPIFATPKNEKNKTGFMTAAS